MRVCLKKYPIFSQNIQKNKLHYFCSSRVASLYDDSGMCLVVVLLDLFCDDPRSSDIREAAARGSAINCNLLIIFSSQGDIKELAATGSTLKCQILMIFSSQGDIKELAIRGFALNCQLLIFFSSQGDFKELATILSKSNLFCGDKNDVKKFPQRKVKNNNNEKC